MYHPTRGGVRGGRDQFSWDDVKVDKHRENYLGHSIKAPIGRWQKGKDLHWYTKDKSSSDMDALKEEIKLIKEREEQAMREALGLAPMRSGRSQGNRLDKHEFSELVKRESTAEDLGRGHSEAAQVEGLGFLREARVNGESRFGLASPEVASGRAKVAVQDAPSPSQAGSREDSDDERGSRKRRREERKHGKHERHHGKAHHARDDSDSRRAQKRRRHDTDSE